jgi:hypothetical protein
MKKFDLTIAAIEWSIEELREDRRVTNCICSRRFKAKTEYDVVEGFQAA